MKKGFTVYAALWAVLLVAFNAVVFLVRPVIPGFTVSYDGRFWVAWGFITLAFAGNLLCAFIAFKAENLKKMFYKLPLITLSRSALIAMLIVGAGLMLVPNCPAWIAAIVCVLIAAFNAIAVIKAAWAGDAVEKIDEKVKTQTAFIRSLTVDADGLLARAQSEPIKAECKKVYEAVRYSDPMSNEALSVIEAKITVQMDALAGAVAAQDEAAVGTIANEVLILLNDRNNKCKLLK